MRLIMLLLLVVTSVASGGDQPSSTNAIAAGPVVLVPTVAAFTRDGTTNLVRTTLSNASGPLHTTHVIYHGAHRAFSASQFIGDGTQLQCSKGLPVSITLSLTTNGILSFINVRSDTNLLDRFTVTNGLISPVSSGDLCAARERESRLREQVKEQWNRHDYSTQNNRFEFTVGETPDTQP